MDKLENARLWLESEYLARRRKNPAYSLRAFARLLDLPSGRVSQLLAQKRRLTPRLSRQIANRLGYDPEKTARLLRLVEKGKKAELATTSPAATYRQLNMDQFQAIADPVHFAILSLAETDDFRGDPRFVGRRLGLSASEARAAMDRLVRIQLLRKAENGAYALAQAPGLTTTHDVPSTALRRAHRSVLREVIDLLDAVDLDSRDVTSITMAVDPERLKEAKLKIREFRRGLSEFLEGGKRKEVYRLNIQLVPVTKKEKR
jgi:uncharacterized protein (TIGR02147 family)